MLQRMYGLIETNNVEGTHRRTINQDVGRRKKKMSYFYVRVHNEQTAKFL